MDKYEQGYRDGLNASINGKPFHKWTLDELVNSHCLSAMRDLGAGKLLIRDWLYGMAMQACHWQSEVQKAQKANTEEKHDDG